MPSSQPTNAEVTAALERILASRAFRTAGRHKRFLRFVVEETLAARDERLKGYTIAMDVFDRSKDFDPQTDSLVRVEAGRLRHRLAEYYSLEGAGDAVRIGVPRGAYRASFAYVRAPGVSLPASDRQPDVPWRASRAVVLVGVVLALGTALWAVTARDSSPSETATGQPADPATRRPVVLIAPIATMTNDAGAALFARSVFEEVPARLAGVGFEVIVPATMTGPSAHGSRASHAPDAPEPDYVVTGTIRSDASTARLAVRVVDALSGAQLWAQRFDEALAGGGTLSAHEAVGNDIVAGITSAVAETTAP